LIDRAKAYDIPYQLITRPELNQPDGVLSEYLEYHNIDFVILAGFLWLIPTWLIDKYPKRIINVHPSLLPKYGGKGLYGHHVHQSVFENKESQTGITVHIVNPQYDEGDIIAQVKVDISDAKEVETIEKRIQDLHYQHYPSIIEKYIIENKL
jgi:phosphoribosylglycinamide formyltransferase-1